MAFVLDKVYHSYIIGIFLRSSTSDDINVLPASDLDLDSVAGDEPDRGLVFYKFILSSLQILFKIIAEHGDC